MIYYIVVFRSKTDVFNYLSLLRSRGIPCSTIGTPKEAGIGCGLAVKISQMYLTDAKYLLFNNRFASFYAIYQVVRKDGRVSTSKII